MPPGESEKLGEKPGLVRYEDVGATYLEERKLRKSAGWVLLWALGVGAVISGDFFGWNYGLEHGGFLGLAVATCVMAAMYLCMVFSIAELSAALPHAGGFYSFVRSALGPTAGFLCGVTDAIEYVLTPAAIVVSIAEYMEKLLPGLVPAWAWWIAAYAFFTAINIRGAALTLRLGLAVTICAVLVLVAFYVSAIVSGAFQWDDLWNIKPVSGATWRLPRGWTGVITALPFATWFFLAIEQLPLAAEETHDVVRDMPRALLLGIATLLALSLLTLVLNSGVAGGAAAIQKSGAPLADGFQAILGAGATASVLTLIALTGLFASFHTIIYAYGRVLFALSRAGYFPRWISVTSRWHTPHRALLVGSAAGLGATLAVQLGAKDALGQVLVTISVAGAVVSYFLVLVSFIALRRKRPDLDRPYRSPLGVPGAAAGAALALVVLAACFGVEDYRNAMFGVAAFLAAAMLYFLLYSRARLVAQAPEEQAALRSQAER